MRAYKGFGHGCSSHRILLEHKWNYALGMDVEVTVYSWNTNEIMVWTGCSSHRILVEHKRNYDLGMDALITVFSWNTNGIFGLGMDALVTVFSWNTNGIMVWAWML